MHTLLHSNKHALHARNHINHLQCMFVAMHSVHASALASWICYEQCLQKVLLSFQLFSASVCGGLHSSFVVVSSYFCDVC